MNYGINQDMKIACDFCKTEYNVPGAQGGAVKCAVCGHAWRVAPPSRRGAWMVFFASLCALLAAVVFTVVVVAHHRAAEISNRPLIATVAEVKPVLDAGGVAHFVVRGHIVNQSDEIYGVPDLIIVSRDEAGAPIARQKFLPTTPLLDPGASVEFSHTLSAPATGVKKITVELKDQEVAQ